MNIKKNYPPELNLVYIKPIQKKNKLSVSF